MSPAEAMKYALGSGFTQQYSQHRDRIYEESVDYAKKRAREEGHGYLPGDQNAYFKEKNASILREFAGAAKRRKKPKVAADHTDEVIQAVAQAERSRARVGFTTGSTLGFLSAPDLSTPSLTSRTLLGG